MKFKPYFLIICISVLISCDKEITLDALPYSSKLVMNGEFNNDNTISLEVSRSLPVMQGVDSSGFLIKNATVIIYDNGIEIDTAKYFSGYYVLNYKPIPGHQYTVTARSGKYPPAQAKLNMPGTLNTVVSYKDSVGLDNSLAKIGQLNLSFLDDGSQSNYYKLLIRYYDDGLNTWFPLKLESNDVIFLNNTKLNDGSFVFSDNSFSGKQKHLSFSIKFGTAMGTPKFEISLKTFNSDYYDYLRGTDDYSQSGNGFSANPVIIKSNVTNGLGMIGGVSNARDTIY